MKKILIGIIILGITVPTIASNTTFQDVSEVMNEEVTMAAAAAKSGKWVAEYGGGSTPFRCICTSHILRTQCLVGDFSSDLSLCE